MHNKGMFIHGLGVQIFVLLTVVGSLFSVHSQTTPDYALQRAKYLFELEGEYIEAVQILEQLKNQSNSQIAIEAALYLGKIHTLNNDNTKALEQYELIYSSPLTTSTLRKSIAEYLAQHSDAPAQKVLFIQKTKEPVRQILSTDPSLFQFNNNQIKSFHNYEFHSLPLNPGANETFAGYQSGMYYTISPSQNQLHLFTINNQEQSFDQYPKTILQFYILHNNSYLVTTQDSIYAKNFGKTLWQKPNPLPQCSISTQLNYTQELVFLCKDNSVHLLDATTGVITDQIAMVGKVQAVAAYADGLAIAQENKVFYFRPTISISPEWEKDIKKIYTLKTLGATLLMQKRDGDITALDLPTGKIQWTISPGRGNLYTFSTHFCIISPTGVFQYFDEDGNFLWSYQSGFAESSPPRIIKNQIVLPLRNSSLVFLNPFYLGHRKNFIHQLIAKNVPYFQNKDWDPLLGVIEKIHNLEYGNSQAWIWKSHYYESQKNDDSTKQALLQAILNTLPTQEHEQQQQQLLKQYAGMVHASWVQPINLKQNYHPELVFQNNKNLVYIDLETQQIIAKDLKNGELVWSAETGSIDADPIILQKVPYLIISHGSQIKIFNLDTKGKLIGQVDLPGPIFQISADSSIIAISTWNGNITAFDFATLRQLWQIYPFKTRAKLSISNTTIYALSPSQLVKINPANGKIIQQRRFSSSHLPQELTSNAQFLLVNTGGNYLQALDSNLEIRWNRTLEAQPFSMQIHENSIVLGLANQQIESLNIQNGNRLWSYQGNGSLFIRPHLAKEQIMIDQGHRIVALHPTTGKKINTITLPETLGPVYTSDSNILVTSQSGLLYNFPFSK
jgi:outer membrane protein assembly factor BamB